MFTDINRFQYIYYWYTYSNGPNGPIMLYIFLFILREKKMSNPIEALNNFKYILIGSLYLTNCLKI